MSPATYWTIILGDRTPCQVVQVMREYHLTNDAPAVLALLTDCETEAMTMGADLDGCERAWEVVTSLLVHSAAVME